MSDSAFSDLAAQLRPECDAIVAQYERPRSALLPIIHLFARHQGYVTRDAMRATAAMLDLTPAVVESTVSFYSLFFRQPVGKYVLQVCRGLSCTINGADDIMAYFREKLGLANQQSSADGLFSYEEVECLAACDRATCMQVNLEFVYDLTPQIIDDLIASIRAGTFHVAPIVQSAMPQKTWIPRQDGEVADGEKSPGATDVAHPNNAGGLGDPSGVIMLDRIVNREIEFAARSRERLVQDSRAVFAMVEDGSVHAGH